MFDESLLCFTFRSQNMMAKYNFPDLANHLNLALVLNTFQITTILYMLLLGPNRSTSGTFPTHGQYFQLIRPWIAIFVSMTYFFAGFHKLNWDYLNPDVSCTRNFLERRIFKHYGISKDVQVSSEFIQWSSILTLAWEIGGAFMIFVPKTQPIMMIYSLLMHMVFATIGFYDFTSMMCSLWFVLLPDPYLRIIVDDPFEKTRRWTYVMLPLVMMVCTILYNPNSKNRTITLRLGLCFIATVSFLLWPLIKLLLSTAISNDEFRRHHLNQSLKWQQSFRWSLRPRFLWFFPLFLTFYSMNNYLGLRTAGNFTMFSNIRTEGRTSNHLLLGKNQLKIFGYQDDIVQSNAFALPLVEFQRRILKMKRGRQRDLAKDPNARVQPFGVSALYKGELIDADDVVTDPRWDFEPSWEHYWLHFRTIQDDDQPNKCRW